MRNYIIRRLLFLVVVVWMVSALVFVLIRVIPGDVAALILGEMGTEETHAQLKHQLGYDRPLVVQYGDWMKGVFQGDLGHSLWTGKSTLSELKRRIPVTLELTVMALIIAWLIGIPAGVLSAIRQDSPTDYAARLIAIMGLAMPGFWIAILMLTFSTKWFHWAPPLQYHGFFDSPSKNLQQFIMPAFCDGLIEAAIGCRMTRSCLLEVLRQDYIRTAWAKGLRERLILSRHALKNALIPTVTIMGTQITVLLGGAIIMEQIFSLPGVGRLTFESIMQRDYPQLQTNVLFLSTLLVTMNFLVDLSYAWLDPRIRYK